MQLLGNILRGEYLFVKDSDFRPSATGWSLRRFSDDNNPALQATEVALPTVRISAKDCKIDFRALFRVAKIMSTTW